MCQLPYHIAVVEDDTAIRDLIVETLQDEGYVVTPYPSGRDAEYGLIQDPPNLVILDMHLEHHNSGLQVLKTLDQSPATAALPVILASADRVFLNTLTDAIQQRPFILLHKPFYISEFLVLVATLLPVASGPQPQ